jgi:hypothetical protein
MVTIAPRFLSIIPGRSSFTVRNVEVRFESMIERHSSSVVSCTGVIAPNPPANATSTSTGPSEDSTRERIAAMSAALHTSPGTASPPMSETTAPIAVSSRPPTATRTSFAASARAVAAPMPREPPVTRATLPARSGYVT